MKKYITVLAAFIIMLCIGSIYAWSIIAAELIQNFGFSGSESQIIFGMIIAVFPLAMIFVGQLGKKFNHRYLSYTSGVLFFSGYLLAGYSGGNFWIIFLGIGLMSGIATAFGYWVSLTSPVQWFPDKKGLITGIAAAGFGLGAVFMSEIAEHILNRGYDVLELLRIIGVSYGLIIIVLANFIFQNPAATNDSNAKLEVSEFINTDIFRKLCWGIFLGTFAGLLIIGSLKIIGQLQDVSAQILINGVAVFAFANFAGRLAWGFISDYIGASLTIFFALLVQALAIISLNLFELSDISYLVLSFCIGFGFGGNFVLFAREVAQRFGLNNLGLVYPYVFIGYAIAGIAGPFSGGLIFDLTNSFNYAITLASIMSLAGSILFLRQHILYKEKAN